MSPAALGLVAGGVALVAVGIALLLDWRGTTTWIAGIWIRVFQWLPGVRRSDPQDRLRHMRLRWRMTGAGWLLVGGMLVAFGLFAPPH